ARSRWRPAVTRTCCGAPRSSSSACCWWPGWWSPRAPSPASRPGGCSSRRSPGPYRKGEVTPVCGSVPRNRKPGFTWVLPSLEQALDRAGADRPAALADGEAQAGLERDRLAELDGHGDPVAGG